MYHAFVILIMVIIGYTMGEVFKKTYHMVSKEKDYRGLWLLLIIFVLIVLVIFIAYIDYTYLG